MFMFALGFGGFIFAGWDYLFMVGWLVFVVRVDGKGRIVIPKSVRDALGIRVGQPIRVRVEGGRIVLVPLRGVADEYYGSVGVERWPADLDEFLVEAVREWWRKGT